MIQKRDLNYVTGILLIFVFLWMFITGLIQVRFELHRFIYHLYGAYLLIFLSVIHLWINGKKISYFFKKKINYRNISTIVSTALIFSLFFTLVSGFLQVKLNFPLTRFAYHIYSACSTLIIALLHVSLNIKKINTYLKSVIPACVLTPDRTAWKPFVKIGASLGAGILIIIGSYTGLELSLYREQENITLISKKPARKESTITAESTSDRPAPIDSKIAVEYHKKTKHTLVELMKMTGGLDWARRPTVFKEYPRAESIKLSTDFDFNSISVEEAIATGPFRGSFSGEAITQKELSLILHHTNGITDELRYPGLTYYLRAAPSAGALYPTVIYLLINNVEGLKKGIYHYSVKDHSLFLLKQGNFIEKCISSVPNPSRIKKASVVFIMSTIFYRTKWKYRERGYRYVLLDTGHVAGNLTLIARALGLGSYSIGTFIDDTINLMLDIEGTKEAVVYMNPVGRIDASKGQKQFKKVIISPEEFHERLPQDLTIAELLHEKGKLNGFKEIEHIKYKVKKIAWKSYPEAKRLHLSGEFSKHGLSLSDAIRTRRSARDYSGKPISKREVSRLLYYTYGRMHDNQSPVAVWSIEELYPVEIYVVINNVDGIAQGIYHYNVSEHALELLKQGNYRFRIANACLGQGLVGNANIAIIKTVIFERIKRFGNRGYRYIHLDAGAIGENIYLEAISMGLGVCGIGAFFDDKINEMLGIDGKKETVIYVTSVGRLS